MSAQNQLQRAYELIKAGQKGEATQIIVEVLRQDRDSADAWWLLANATADPTKARQALQQVLRLRPDHAAAQRMMDTLDPASAPPPPVIASAPPPVEADPFADPFAAPPTPVSTSFGDLLQSSQTDAPFGDPFTSPPPRAARRSTIDDDPFADPFTAPRARPMDEDPFASDQPFAAAEPRPAARAPQPQRKGASPLVIILAILGGIFVIGLIICALTTFAGVSLFTQAVQTALPEGTFQAAIEEMQAILTDMPTGMIGDIVPKGSISPNQPIRARLEEDGVTNHGYTFSGTSGQRVTFEVAATDNEFDTKLHLLAPDGTQINYNDDREPENTNSLIVTTLPETGEYTIVVGDFGADGGAYELLMR